MDGYFILQSSTIQVVVAKCTYRKLWIKRTALQLVISTNKPSAQKFFCLSWPERHVDCFYYVCILLLCGFIMIGRDG